MRRTCTSFVVAWRRRRLARVEAERTTTAGFMLTETLATFTISAFVLLALVSSASVLMHSVDRSLSQIESVDDLGRALAVISHDVAGLRRARWNGIEPQAFVFRGGPNSVFFARSVRESGRPDATQVVALREIGSSTGPRLVRSVARLPARATSFDDLMFGPQREIWTGAARLRFAYVPQRQGREEPLPRHDWPIGQHMPSAILIEAIDRDTRRVLVASRVTFNADADIGCVDASDAGGASASTGASAVDAAAAQAPQGGGGINFADIPAQQKLPDPLAPAVPTAAQTGADGGFCGRLDDDKDKKSQQPGVPPSSAPSSVAAGTAP